MGWSVSFAIREIGKQWLELKTVYFYIRLAQIFGILQYLKFRYFIICFHDQENDNELIL